MTPAEVNVILDKALEMTRQMLSYAREENWVEVAKLEGERQKSLMEGLANTDVEKSEMVSQKVQQIMDVDREMQELVVRARDGIRDELIQLNKDKNAAKAYDAK